MASPIDAQELIPKKMIRRFDIFAEYNRIKYQQKGMPPDQAKGYGLWMAKVIAERKFATTPEKKAEMTHLLGQGSDQLKAGAKFLEFKGKYQTDELFDKEIIQRMGDEFYHKVFSPAIAKAIEDHESYETIRDSLRVPWNLRMAA